MYTICRNCNYEAEDMAKTCITYQENIQIFAKNCIFNNCYYYFYISLIFIYIEVNYFSTIVPQT